MRVFVAGCPHDVGGAGPHMWNLIKLWRSNGVDVTVLPYRKVNEKWTVRLAAAGVNVVHLGGKNPERVDGLRGGVVMGFCDPAFIEAADRFRQFDCRLVWSGCMSFVQKEERERYRLGGKTFDRWIVNSLFQRSCIEPLLLASGYKPEQITHIPTAIDVSDYPFSPLPHEPRMPFTIGRLSRPDADKFSRNTWKILGAVPYPLKARVLGWSDKSEAKCGPPPKWAECLPVGSWDRLPFYRTLHAMVQINGGARENRPRTCLESMALGVPVVAQNAWGWKELIHHGRTGFLCDNQEEFAYYIAELAKNEPRRLEMARAARESLVTEIAPPEAIWKKWEAVFNEE